LKSAISHKLSNSKEVADFNANILNITYTDAWVNFTDTISIIAQPENQNILTNSIAEFLVDADNVQSYAWQSFENGTWLTLFDGGIISGASTNSLSIINPGLDWNGRYFRCQLSGCNNAVSDSAILQVQLGDGFLYETNIDWDFYPNPLRENAHIFLHLLPASHCNLQLFDSKGIFIEELCDGIISSTDELLLFSAKKYPAGNYIIKLKINVHGKIMCSEKQIIITN
ncbi:MAG: hypothetical protein U9R19_16110, partial [Bacteroidota bacterium]|nr:hypothetical protein [Bacteroidota bacterium]